MSKRICIFGTSITWGAWDPEGGGWVNRLRRYIELKMESKEIEDKIIIYNLSVDGDNSDNIVKRFENEYKRRIAYEAEDFIIFDVGINDSSYREGLKSNKVSLKKYKENIKELINKSKKYTDNIIIIGITAVNSNITNPIPWDTDVYYKNENIKIYNKALLEICRQNNIDLIKMNGLIKREDLEDGLHPNSAGHEKIFQKVKDYLIKNKKI